MRARNIAETQTRMCAHVYGYCLQASIHTHHLPRSIKFISKVAEVLLDFTSN